MSVPLWVLHHPALVTPVVNETGRVLEWTDPQPGHLRQTQFGTKAVAQQHRPVDRSSEPLPGLQSVGVVSGALRKFMSSSHNAAVMAAGTAPVDS